MSNDDWTIQDSLSLGQGKSPGLLTNLRSSGDDEEAAGRLLVAGLARIPTMLALNEQWVEQGGNTPVQIPRPPTPTQAPSHAQAVQNVTQGLGATPVAPGKPGNGEIYPGKFCGTCSSPRVVASGVSKKTNKLYYRLDCASDAKGHDVDWSMNPKS